MHTVSALALTWGSPGFNLIGFQLSLSNYANQASVSEIPGHTGTAGCIISKFTANPFSKHQGAACFPWYTEGPGPSSSDGLALPAQMAWLLECAGAILLPSSACPRTACYSWPQPSSHLLICPNSFSPTDSYHTRVTS